MTTSSNENDKSRYAHTADESGKTSLQGRFLDFYEVAVIKEADDDSVFTIPLEMENRPDKISNHFYSTPRFMWVILLRNNIKNPLLDLRAGTRIRIPSVTRLYSEILN